MCAIRTSAQEAQRNVSPPAVVVPHYTKNNVSQEIQAIKIASQSKCECAQHCTLGNVMICINQGDVPLYTYADLDGQLQIASARNCICGQSACAPYFKHFICIANFRNIQKRRMFSNHFVYTESARTDR